LAERVLRLDPELSQVIQAGPHQWPVGPQVIVTDSLLHLELGPGGQGPSGGAVLDPGDDLIEVVSGGRPDVELAPAAIASTALVAAALSAGRRASSKLGPP
jgi:hypothetical protein